MLKKKLLKKAAVIGMMATMITGCSQEVQTTHVDGLNSLGKIEVVSREEESGTRNVFAEKTGILDETTGKDIYRRELVAGQSARLLCGYIYASAGD